MRGDKFQSFTDPSFVLKICETYPLAQWWVSEVSEDVGLRKGEPTEAGRWHCHLSQGNSHKEIATEFVSPSYTKQQGL